MIQINLVAVGKIKEKYFKDAISEYEKRISRYAQFKIIEVKEFPDTNRALKQEEENILKNLTGGCFLLDLGGKQVSSEDLASVFENAAVSGESKTTFIIGSSRGVSDEVKRRVDKKIAFGLVTYPHQLMRVILVEQIYRALTINAGSEYHK